MQQNACQAVRRLSGNALLIGLTVRKAGQLAAIVMHENIAEQQHTWNKDLCKGHIVVRDKDHLEQVPNVRIAVDLAANSIDHLDDLFGTLIPWSCLATNDTCSGHHLHTLILLSHQNAAMQDDAHSVSHQDT